MACYYPLKAVPVGITKEGKTQYRVISYDKTFYNIDGSHAEYIEVPCGKCIGCRLAYSRQWADRCMAEASEHESNYFVTLTYDDEHIKRAITKDGVITDYPTLDKRDIQLFLKRLRKSYKQENKIRFFMAGEYGSQTARPHYHLIIFGLKLDDLKLYKRTGQGFNLYTSDFLSKVWQNKGYVIVADVTWETCAYTARYILKKQNGNSAEWIKENNIQQEFTLMSRRPGIGKSYFEKHKEDYLKYGETNIITEKGGRKIRSTKYFDRFLDIEYPKEREERKRIIKEKMEVIKQKKLEQTDMDYLTYLETQEQIKKNKVKYLPRKEI